MVKEVIEYLNCQPDGVYVDATLGSGGHSLEILKFIAPNGRLIGIDCDLDAIETATCRLKDFRDRVKIIHDNFKAIRNILTNLDIYEVDGILLDLGVSSIQLGDKERGFSFRLEGPIDMRMDRRSVLKAFDLINGLPISELESTLWKYGEERFAKRIARAIATQRKSSPITTTIQLADITKTAIPSRFHPKRIHPATKTFQAIRIAVNDELTNLDIAIENGVDLLKEGGRLCIIAFHSLEDRIVKQFFRSLERVCICPPDMPACICRHEPKVKVLTKKPVRPSVEEINKNPRSRTAKLRVVERI